jgi:chemotaxis protein MotB
MSLSDASASIFFRKYSSSQVDKRKAGRLAMAIQVAFQELGVFQTSSTKVPIKDEEAIPFEKVQIVENINKEGDMKRIVNPMKGVLSGAGEPQSLEEAQNAIQKALDPEIQRHEVTMSMRREGLVVSLKEMGFFDSGSATVRPGSLDAISRLAVVLKQRPENLRIEGHTDNIPIHTARFASNWELSTSRATDLIQLLIAEYGLPPGHLSAAGYGEFHPVADNDTPEGRAQNRRLDVVILAPFQPLEPSQQNGKLQVPEPADRLDPSAGHP